MDFLSYLFNPPTPAPDENTTIIRSGLTATIAPDRPVMTGDYSDRAARRIAKPSYVYFVTAANGAPLTDGEAPTRACAEFCANVSLSLLAMGKIEPDAWAAYDIDDEDDCGGEAVLA
jgi:hypothetical protein